MPANRNTRPRGTGSLRTRPDKSGRETWYGSWYDAHGKRVQRALGPVKVGRSGVGMTRPEAERDLQNRIAQYRPADRRAAPSHVQMTIAGIASLIDADQLAAGRAPSTRRTFQNDVHNHLVPFFGDRDLSTIRTDDVNAFVAFMLREGKITRAAGRGPSAPKSVRNARGSLAQILTYAITRGWLLPPNVCTTAILPAVPEDDDLHFLTVPQLAHFAAHGPQTDWLGQNVDGDLYVLAGQTGLRQGELLALRHRDCDLAARRVRVNRRIYQGVVGPTKGKERRSVPMSADVATVIARRQIAAGVSPESDRLVFAGEDGVSPITRRRIGGDRFKRALDRARIDWPDLPDITFHDLRHTFGTTMVRTGQVDIYTLGRWMGHKHVGTTAIYLHYRPSAGEAAIVSEAFGALNVAAFVDDDAEAVR